MKEELEDSSKFLIRLYTVNTGSIITAVAKFCIERTSVQHVR
jgi:hypothetical protein